MGLNDVDGLEGDGIEDEDITRGRGNVGGKRWSMLRASLAGVLSRLGQGISDIAVLGGGRKSADGGRIWRGRYNVEQGHVRNIVKVNLLFKDNS